MLTDDSRGKNGKRLMTKRKNLTTAKARKMANARETHAGGRPRIPTPCPKCSAQCDSYRKAMAHC